MDTPKLGCFTRQYIETALWSSIDEDGEPLDGLYSIDDISEETLKEMIEDCRQFQSDHHDLIANDPSRAGHDFWLTRNRHGAGFWDGDWPEKAGKQLTDAAHIWGSYDLYIGDDGNIHGT